MIDPAQLGNTLRVGSRVFGSFQMTLRGSRIRAWLQFIDERLGLRNLGTTEFRILGSE